ncbi:aminotransferase [Bacillus sp. FJAT-18017]|uniref:LL-diaminopimelate aminotransferase n=1 Tax=Bacillus sp. FJAT-18017 TaxID=1705566 RepID=UPI0006AED220|nr:LL-diaminopimelate aminotransferase [Bacillus sp. FJAT-18017]ALC89364.1 aminotransferase [Bacillus sp. FJAT-18017]
MNLVASTKMEKLTTGIFTELANRKQGCLKRGMDVIDLSVGSPDLPPPKQVMDTIAEYSMDPSNYGYTLKGTAEFNEAVSYFYKKRYGVELDSSAEVLQLMGSHDGLSHLAIALVDPGEYVLVPDPGYPIYEAGVTIAGGNIYPMPLFEENGFFPVFEDIPEDVLKRTKMMILGYPGNPVPQIADRRFFKKVVEFARKYEILVVHDFAYSELIFDSNPQISFLSVEGAKEVGIEFNSLSKTFNVAGCRIGYVAGNAQALQILASLKSHMDYGVFLPIQKAATSALTGDHSILDEQVKVYEERRNVLIEGLTKGGWKVDSPAATMFVWARIPEGWTSRQFAFDLIEKAGVAVVPGDAFGKQGEGYVRIALVQPADRLAVAAERIRQFLIANPSGETVEV